MQQKHLSWLGIILGLIGLALSPLRWAAFVFAPLLIVSLIAWAWSSGWRVRSPLRRVKPVPPRTPQEEERLNETREVRDALTQLLHARCRPAVQKLVALCQDLVGVLQERGEPAFSLGLLTEMYPLMEIEHAERKLRRRLEGVFWDETEHVELARFARDMDLEKQSASQLALDFFFYFVEYERLYWWVKRFAQILSIDSEDDRRFNDWRRLHEQVVDQLREILARPELGSLRDDFEKHIAEMEK
ncbi:MAG: hypothetical protein GEU73_16795 [Chloroflexi bacterium]|nr:hypothetical protein [Chloroflexota bacterium]